MQRGFRESICACLKEHIQTVNSMRRSHLPYSFIMEYGEAWCLEICGAIVSCGVEESIQKLSDDGIRYLMNDPDFLEYLKRIQNAGGKIEFSRVDRILALAQGACLSKLEYKDILKVLRDEKIPADLQFPYLKYFMQECLDEKEKKQVIAGLDKFNREVRLNLDALSRRERSFIRHPLFMTELMGDLLREKSTWELLTWPGVLPLLERIQSMNPRIKLWIVPFHQLIEATEEIQGLLDEVLPYFHQEQQEILIRFWLDNCELVADLKRLVKILPRFDETQKKELLSSRAAYVVSVYQAKLENIPLQELGSKQTQVLIYAVLSGKKHFLKLINEHSDAFQKLGYYSLILDPRIYQSYLNLNTLNEKNLRDGASLPTIRDACRQYLNRQSYTFEELRTLTARDKIYYQLYGLLTNQRSDDRLRVLKELLKHEALPDQMEEEKLAQLAKRLSIKPLSRWLREELGHIKELHVDTAIELLSDWETYESYIADLSNGRQAAYLIRNQDLLRKYKTFGELQENLVREDRNWIWLRETLGITEEFTQQYKEAVHTFICQGDAQIVYEFCRELESDQKLENVRRLLAAELMGAFEQVKYHKGDLQKEISYPVDEKTETIWKGNSTRTEGEFRAWEEDRFIPVLQIGEKPMQTCLSYRDGQYKKCLLSCYDANKKVIYLEENGKTVFRAMLRLTKGASTRNSGTKQIEFADLTCKEEKKSKAPAKEELILFLERPYISGLNEGKVDKAVSCVYHLVQEKARKLGALPVISMDYKGYDAFAEYRRKTYYVYISASKNGEQYLDSLGGMAVNSSGSYESGTFLLPGEAKSNAA